jgi:hypothetical protein
MAANRQLASQRGISDDDVRLIDLLHEHMEVIIDNTLAVHDLPMRLAYLRELEFQLQDLWKFDRDSRYHTWCQRLINRHRGLSYAGAKFECTATGAIRVLEQDDVEVGGIIGIGKGFIDFGGVVRLVGVRSVV